MPVKPNVTLSAESDSSILLSTVATPDSGQNVTSFDVQRSLDGVTWTNDSTTPVREDEVPPFYNVAATKTVSKTGPWNNTTTFATIQAAIDTIIPGDVVAVGPGVYNEIVHIKRSGTTTQPIIIRALDPNNKPTVDGAFTLPGADTGYTTMTIRGVKQNAAQLPLAGSAEFVTNELSKMPSYNKPYVTLEDGKFWFWNKNGSWYSYGSPFGVKNYAVGQVVKVAFTFAEDPRANEGPYPRRLIEGRVSTLVTIEANNIIWDSINVIRSKSTGMLVGNSTNAGWFYADPQEDFTKVADPNNYDPTSGPVWSYNVKVLRSDIKKSCAIGLYLTHVYDCFVGQCDIREAEYGSFYSREQHLLFDEPLTPWACAVMTVGKNISLIENIIAQTMGEGIHCGHHVYRNQKTFKQAVNLKIKRNIIFDNWSSQIYLTQIQGGEIDSNIIYHSGDTRFYQKFDINPANWVPGNHIDVGSESASWASGLPPPDAFGGAGSQNVVISNNVSFGAYTPLYFSKWTKNVFKNLKFINNTFFNVKSSVLGNSKTYASDAILDGIIIKNNIFNNMINGRMVERWWESPNPWRWGPVANLQTGYNLWSHTPPSQTGIRPGNLPSQPIALSGPGDVVNTNPGITNLNYTITAIWTADGTVPLFDSNAFKLVSSSPAINAGQVNVADVPRDFFGNKRRSDSSDIGVHAYFIANDQNYRSRGLTASTQYRYRVRYTQGNGSVSDWSDVKLATTLASGGSTPLPPTPPPPTPPSGRAKNNGKLEPRAGAFGKFSSQNNGVIELDGVDDFISTSTLYTPSQVNTITIGAWFQTSDIRGRKIVGFENNQLSNASSYDRHLYVGIDGRLRFGVYPPGGSLTTITSPDEVNDDSWYYAVATLGGGVAKLYIDGIKVGEVVAAAGENFSGYWKIGGSNLSGWVSTNANSANGYFKGKIGPIHIYNRVLTDQEIINNYNAEKLNFKTLVTPTISTVATTSNSISGTVLFSSPNVLKYTIQKSVSPTGPWQVLTYSKDFVDTGLSSSTNYYYRAKIVQSNGMSSDWGVVTTVRTNATSIKWHPGHYAWIAPDLFASSSATLGSILSFIDSIANESTVKGIQVMGYWGEFEGATAGDYSRGFATMDAILARAALHNKYVILSVMPAIFGNYGSDWSVFFPAYLINQPQYGITVFNINGNGLQTRIWQAATTDRLNALAAAYGARYNSHPNFEMFTIGETSINLTEGTNGYSFGAFDVQLKRQMVAAAAAFPNTIVRLGANYYGSDAAMISLINYAAALKIGVGGPDIEPRRGIQANEVFTGAVPGSTDQRGVVPFIAETQAPFLGGKGGTYTIEQLYLAAMQAISTNSGGATGSGSGVFRATQPQYFVWFVNNYSGGTEQRWDTGILPFIRSINGAVFSTACPTSFGGKCLSSSTP